MITLKTCIPTIRARPVSVPLIIVLHACSGRTAFAERCNVSVVVVVVVVVVMEVMGDVGG